MNYTQKILEKARTEKGIYWISVYEDGVTTTESITPANLANDCYSVSKGFTVTALGMLYDDGLLSTDERIIDIFDEELPENLDPNWEKVTVDNVMSHRWGIGHGFLDIDSEDPATFGEKYGSRNDFLKNVFSVKLPKTPGDESEDGRKYSDAAYYLLSRVVTKKTGKTLFDFLRERLFTPLEFAEAAWSTCPYGYTMGATGLYVRTPDMVKLGLLYLNGGTLNGKRYFSEEWRDIVVKHNYAFYQSKPGIIEKGGMHGQDIVINTNNNVVVAWLGYDTDGHRGRMFDFIAGLE